MNLLAVAKLGRSFMGGLITLKTRPGTRPSILQSGLWSHGRVGPTPLQYSGRDLCPSVEAYKEMMMRINNITSRHT